jgi:hypothetical protein
LKEAKLATAVKLRKRNAALIAREKAAVAYTLDRSGGQDYDVDSAADSEMMEVTSSPSQRRKGKISVETTTAGKPDKLKVSLDRWLGQYPDALLLTQVGSFFEVCPIFLDFSFFGFC